MTAHPGGPGSRQDLVRLIVELGPAPEEHERWWWAKQVCADNSPVMHSYRKGLLNVQLDTPRDGLEERARQIRRGVADANARYPARYDADRLARAQRQSAEDVARQTDADQAVIDRVMTEPN